MFQIEDLKAEVQDLKETKRDLEYNYSTVNDRIEILESDLLKT